MSDQPIELKTAKAAEKFWLVASVATTAYVAWTLASEGQPRWSLALFPVISWLWYGVRRVYRHKLEARSNP